MSSSPGDEARLSLGACGGLTAVIAVGNSMRGDDGAGPFIASRLVNSDSLAVFDAGLTPENAVDGVIGINPSRILFIDAADFGGAPGCARFISKNEITDYTLSTHMFPLRAVWEILEHSLHADIYCVGIQTLDCGWGEGLSPDVARAAEELAALLNSF